MTKRQMFDSRTCYVCLGTVPAREGVYHSDLGILVHSGWCDFEVSSRRKSYDRSPRGRFVPRGVLLRQLRELREAA